MAKGSYNIAGMRSSANKIAGYMSAYESSKKKMVELVASTTQHTDDPIVRDYLEKFENLKTDMESVQNLMNSYSEYLNKAAEAIERGTTPQ